MNLPAAAVTLVIDGVVPKRAVAAVGHRRGLRGRTLAESNFDFDQPGRRAAAASSARSARAVTLTRTKSRQRPRHARTAAAADPRCRRGRGARESADGAQATVCARGCPSGWTASRTIPGRAAWRSRGCSSLLSAGEAGPRTVKVSYLAHGFAWSLGLRRAPERAQRCDAPRGLKATLVNSTGAVFEQAEVQLVAGRLNILAAEEGGSRAEDVFTRGGETRRCSAARSFKSKRFGEKSLCCATASRPTCRYRRKAHRCPL